MKEDLLKIISHYGINANGQTSIFTDFEKMG